MKKLMLANFLSNIIPDLSKVGETVKLICLTIILVMCVKHIIGPLFGFIFERKR